MVVVVAVDLGEQGVDSGVSVGSDALGDFGCASEQIGEPAQIQRDRGAGLVSVS